MKVVILGIDGYLGWPLALHLISHGHEVCGVDDFSRRKYVKDLECDSLTPIKSWPERAAELINLHPSFAFTSLSLGRSLPSHIETFLNHMQPDAIVHLAEMPSAPWSMESVELASLTQYTNVIGTLHLLWAMHKVCPNAHLVKLGTMGEYGTPECDIPEGKIPEECIGGHVESIAADLSKDFIYKCPMSGLEFPRKPGSFYHLSKVHDTYNIEFCCRNWNLSSTDIMQGPVFGVTTASMYNREELITRFDYDEVFGTVINRFCAQALLGHPLTVYGEGGQTRGYLPIIDSMACITLAIENPPEPGEYRTFNQFERTYSINELAEIVSEAAHDCGIETTIAHYENPRKEAETHYYNPAREKLIKLGYRPTTDITGEVTRLIKDLKPYTHRLNSHLVVPRTRWDTQHRTSEII